MLVPESLTENDIETLIEGKRKWIYTKLAEWQDLNATRIHREFVNGEGFLYLGRSYRVKLVEAQEKPVVLKDGYFCLKANGGSADGAQNAFKEFYKEKGTVWIPQRVEFYKDRMGVNPRSVRVFELKNRWASCSKKGNLNFHWKCMMAPLTVIDYIVVHELSHLLHPNHTPEFWNEVDKQLPDYQERKQWLRVNGAGMDI